MEHYQVTVSIKLGKFKQDKNQISQIIVVNSIMAKMRQLVSNAKIMNFNMIKKLGEFEVETVAKVLSRKEMSIGCDAHENSI